MIVHPAVIVHGVTEARAALGPGLPVTLLSAPGAATFAGCLWWREMVARASAGHRHTPMIDILDCADASGLAMGALRSGVCRLVLWSDAPGRAAVAAVVDGMGGFVLPQAPEALDLGQRGALRQLEDWLRAAGAAR